MRGIAFESLEGESVFYLSAAAGDVVPEPTAGLLLGLGIVGLATRRNKEN